MVSDDKTILKRKKESVLACCPLSIRGQIEARGIGVLQLPSIEVVRLSLVIDLGSHTTERLPAYENYSLLGINLRLIYHSSLEAFPEAIYFLVLNSDLYEPWHQQTL